jgi:hypothetical protein
MKSFFAAILLLVAAEASFAGGEGFTASVDKNRLAMGEQLEVTFTLSGSQGGENFTPPSFNDFLTLSGPNQSTNMQFINGVVSQSVGYSYILQPRAEGKFVIGPASITVGGKQLRTAPVTIEVAKGTGQKGTQQQNGSQAQNADLGKQIGDNLFIRAVVDRNHVVQGEQLTLNYKLYWRIDISGEWKYTKSPALTGFWTEDLPLAKPITVGRETINGKMYQVATVKSTALFPQKSGTLSIDPLEVEVGVRVKNRRSGNDIFDQFFNDPFFGGAQTVPYRFHSAPVPITVAPLPQSGAPKDFKGAVGVYTMEAWFDKRETTTNDPVTLKVKISGRGNLKLIEAPTVTTSGDFDRYDPKISDNNANQGTQIAGSRTFEYLMIPRHPGEQKIPPVTFSYYSTEKKQYVTLTSPQFVIAVAKGNDATPVYATGVSKEDVKLLGEDIRFIKSGDAGLQPVGDRFAGSAAFFVLAFSPVAAFIGFIIVTRRRQKMLGNVALLRNRKARAMAKRRLQTASKYLAAKQKEEFYAEVSRALYGYIGDKLGIPPADCSIETVRRELEQRQLPAELIAKLTGTIEQCEFARFAPATDATGMDTVYAEAVSLISDIEDRIR